MVDNFALGYVRIYPGVNSRAELVTLAPGLRPEVGSGNIEGTRLSSKISHTRTDLTS